MSKIYVVVSGEYSDKGVEGVFDDLGLANKFAEQFYDGRIETYELNPVIPNEDKLKNGLHPYEVTMQKNGDGFADTMGADSFGVGPDEYIYQDRLTVKTWAKDTDHALKITNEKRGMIIASGQWNDDYGFK